MKGVERIIFFIGSPILSFPINLYGVFKKSTLSLQLIALTIGFLSFLYIPNWSDDKVVYYQLYSNCEKYGLSYLKDYLASGRPDFILHTLVYLFAFIGLNISWLFFLVTSWTVGVSFYIFNKFAWNLPKNLYFLGFILILISFSLPDLLSGIRFYLASSFVLLGLYGGLIEERKLSFIHFIIGIFIHFSSVLFLVIFIILKLFNKKHDLFKVFFLVSFLFMLLPKSMIGESLKSLGLTGGYEQKAEAYLGEEDFIETGISKGSANYIYVYLMSIAWSYFCYLYLVFAKRAPSILRNITFMTFACINVFYSVTTVYARYLLVAKMIFILLFVADQIEKPNKRLLFIFLLLLLIGIIANLIVMRNNFAESYFNLSIFSLISIIINPVSYGNFL